MKVSIDNREKIEMSIGYLFFGFEVFLADVLFVLGVSVAIHYHHL